MDDAQPTLAPARALLAWLSDAQARGILNAQQRTAELTAEQRRTLEVARAKLAARAPFAAASPVIGPCPEALAAHRAALFAHEQFGAMKKDGWDIAIVDLARVCAVQPFVLADPDARVHGALDPNDLLALARVTVPIPNPQALPYQVDSARSVAILSSPNPNLRVVGFRAQQLGQGTLLGFVVELAPSFVQVAEFGGRFVLTDGHHRAVSLSSMGITRVPALVRKYQHGENLGMDKSVLAPPVYLGARPPLLADYWDPDVSAAVSVPRARKIVMVQALEQRLV
jgi:hypothetical protein